MDTVLEGVLPRSRRGVGKDDLSVVPLRNQGPRHEAFLWTHGSLLLLPLLPPQTPQTDFLLGELAQVKETDPVQHMVRAARLRVVAVAVLDVNRVTERDRRNRCAFTAIAALPPPVCLSPVFAVLASQVLHAAPRF